MYSLISARRGTAADLLACRACAPPSLGDILIFLPRCDQEHKRMGRAIDIIFRVSKIALAWHSREYVLTRSWHSASISHWH